MADGFFILFNLFFLAFTDPPLIIIDTTCFTEMPYALSIKVFTFAVNKKPTF